MPYENYQPIVELTRGQIVECVHFGALAVVDTSGQVLASWGDPQTVTFLRSTAKPFQALPFFEMGGPAAFGLSLKEQAVMCASHTGTDDHVATVAGMQRKFGVSEAALMCGTQTPADEETARQLLLRGEKPTPIRHNCSGKHTGMLGQAVLRKLPIEDYINPDHPVQKAILETFAEMCEMTPEAVNLGTDGCSAPNFAVPLYNTALAFARLADPQKQPRRRAEALGQIFQAMTSHPEMVGGPGSFDTRLMQVAQGSIASKGGAEGYQGIAIQPGVLGKNTPGVGIAYKISDGDCSGRAGHLVALEILRQLGALELAQLKELAQFDSRPLYNWRRLEVGMIRPCFMLEKRPVYYGA